MSINNEERKRLNKVKDKLLQKLLKNDLCVDDLLSPKAGDGKDRKEEKLVSAFSRGFGHLKEKGIVEILGTEFSYSDLMYIFRGMDFAPHKRHFTLAKTISLDDIQHALKLANMPDWFDTSEEDRLEILFGMGLAVRDSEDDEADEEVSKYFVERKHHRNHDNKVKYGWCITANERTDTMWKKSPYASYEAKIYTKDPELAKDLYLLSKSRTES